MVTIPLLLGVCLVTPVHAQPGAVAGDPVDLYRQLISPVISETQVFRIRHVAFDREDLHVVFIDGVIGLMQSVDGHITGAFFEGEGEIALWPPDRAEKTSLAMFTGSGVLDQKFQTAYLRFVDDRLVQQLQSGMRPPQDARGFIQRWREPVKSLARSDSFHLLQALTDSGEASARFLHIRLGGTSLGVFDVFFSTSATEQISVAQASAVKDVNYYDIWTSFPMRSARQAGAAPAARGGPLRASEIRIRTIIRPPAELEAEAELTLAVRRSGQRTLILELSRNLKVTEVRAGGQIVPFIQNEAVDGSDLARRGNDMIAVVLPSALEKNRPLKLTFKYSGAVMFDTGEDLLYVGARGTWYPNPGPFYCSFDLTFEYPEEWTLVATGRRVSWSAAEGRQTARFVTDKPIVHAGFNLGKFETASATVDGIVIDAYAAGNVESELARLEQQAGLRPEPARHVRKISEQAARTVKFLTGELGAFPYSHLEITQLPAMLSQAWPGLIYLSSTAYLTVEERRALKISDPFAELMLDELMLAHETAHQWWGDAVDWESYRDEWIVEALANYSALLMLERESPEKMTVALDHYRHEMLKPVEGGVLSEAGPVTLGTRLTSSKFPGAFEPVLYGRGTWLIHMLRTMLRQTSGAGNDALFFKALNSLLARSPNGKVSTRDLQRAFEQVMPAALAFEGRKSLDWFFDGWVNGNSVPEFSLENVRITTSGARVRASGTIRERFADKDLVTAVPLYARGKDGELKFLALVFVDEPVTAFEINAPPGTRGVVLDPKNTLLRR